MMKIRDELVPTPDPTSLTIITIEKAIRAAADVINARINGIEKGIEIFQSDLTRVPTSVDRAIVGLREIIETRLNCIDHDMTGVHVYMDKRRQDIGDQIKHLNDLVSSRVEELSSVTTERFKAVAAQFDERDTRTDQRAGDTKLAVDAAFAAAKEATAKIEAGFTKQIDAMINIIDTKTANLAGGIGDIKERIAAIESRTQGISIANAENRNSQNDNRGVLFGITSVVISIASLVVVMLLHFVK